MNPASLITDGITFYDGVDATDADNTTRRAQVLLFLQHVYEFTRNYREWSFTYKEGADLTITSGGNSVALPAEYMEFGQSGSLFIPSRKVRLTEKPFSTIERLRKETSGPALDIFGIFAGKIQIPYAVTSDLVLSPFYRTIPATLADGSTEMDIPDRYRNTVILPGLVMRIQQSKSDARQDWAGQFRDGLAQMCVTERPTKTEIRRMPLAYRGAW